MELNLEKPLCFFDLETTGLNIAKDRIVQICIIKLMSDGEQKVYNEYINPTISIPKVVQAVHGITNEKVKDCPTFEDKSMEILEFLKGCDLAGYNSNYYDVPLLVEEFLRFEIEFPEQGTRMIDMNTIFHKKEPRNLTAALKFYAGKDLEGAHDALYDVKATLDVFLGQREKYEDIQNMNMDELEKFCRRQGVKIVDFGGKLKKNENDEIVFAFGKNNGQKVSDHINYAQWMINSDFPLQTKRILQKIVDQNR